MEEPTKLEGGKPKKQVKRPVKKPVKRPVKK
jgi:hypothetical protein